jgi:hypothetical protein
LFLSLFQKLQQKTEVGREERWSIEYLLAESEVIWLNRVGKEFLDSYYVRWLGHMVRLEVIGAVKDPHFIFTTRQAYNSACKLNHPQLIQETLDYFRAEYTQQRQEDLDTLVGEVYLEGVNPVRGKQDMDFYHALIKHTRPPQSGILQITVSPPPLYNPKDFGAIGENPNVTKVDYNSSAAANQYTGYGSVFGRKALPENSSRLRASAKPFHGQGNNRGMPPAYHGVAPPPYWQ